MLAAKRAVKETALSRFVLPAPVLFFPAIANYALVAVGLFPKNVVAGKLLEAALCCASLSVALPMSIALFQQRSSAQVDSLEAEFQNLKSDKDELIKVVYYNKGM